MNVWSKLLTAIKGGVNEAGEAIIDSQAIRILDQEIREADVELNQSKEALASIMAKQKLLAVELDKKEKQITEYEDYALKALEADNESLAREVAEKIANLEQQVSDEQTQLSEYNLNIDRLRQTVSQTETSIKRLKQQVDMVKATESVQKAQIAINKRSGQSQAKMQSALDSFERIKQKQAEQAAKFEAEQELANDSHANRDEALKSKLRAAGIVPDHQNAESVLTRLKQKRNPAS